MANVFCLKRLKNLVRKHTIICWEVIKPPYANVSGDTHLTVTLQKITRDNWEECIDLKVSKDQQGFIASNLYSLAEVQFLPNFGALAIYADKKMVGFTMYGLDEDDHNYWIYRIMIDEKYQGNGYGTKALLQVIENIKLKPDAKEIIIGYIPDNIEAERTYLRAGFQSNGLDPWGEKLVSLKLI